MKHHLYELSDKYIEQGLMAEAIEVLRKILAMNPADEKANYLMAINLYSQGYGAAALDALTAASGNQDCGYDVLYLLGEIQLEFGQLFQAMQAFERASKKKQTYEVNFQMGLIYSHVKKYHDAFLHFERAYEFDSTKAELLINLGAVLRNLGDLDRSLEYLSKAINLDSANPAAWLNKGVTLDSLGQLSLAIAAYEEAIKLDKNYLEAYSNKGNSEMGLGLFQSAHHSFQAALSISPKDVDTLSNYSVLKLFEGNFSDGWLEYESRLYCGSKIFNPYEQIPKLESLSNVENKKILVWAEQGLGDSIQFYRYVGQLALLSKKVTLVVQSELLELLSSNGSEITIAKFGEVDVDQFNCQCALMSLPYLFKTNLDTIPSDVPYIKVDQEKVIYWQDKLSKHDGLKVGLVWSGGLKTDPNLLAMNNRRNIPFSRLGFLSEFQDVNFFSLQKGDGSESSDYLKKNQYWTRDNFFDYSKELKNFSDTAALIQNLDLVITVDTSVAHLAGSLGVPVWILNRYDSCWRWLKGRADSPWYPSAKIFTQHQFDSWDQVLNDVRLDLTKLIQ